MNYSQEPLLAAISAGNIEGETTVPLHIETVISNVFVFSRHAYKVYKNDNEFFNSNFRDLATSDARFTFTERDFNWNNRLSPSVYLEILKVKIEGNIVVQTSIAEELVIKMKRVDTREMLFDLLVAGKISEKDALGLGEQFGQSLERIQTPVPNSDFNVIFEARIEDARAWIASVVEIPETERNAYCDYLQSFRLTHREWFENQLSAEVVADGDFHSHNALYSDQTLYLMDTFPPKEEWGIGHRFIPVYRMGIDICALTGSRAHFESFINGYEKGSGRSVPRELLDPLYPVYVASISVPYLYMLARTDAAKKPYALRYHQFLKEELKKHM